MPCHDVMILDITGTAHTFYEERAKTKKNKEKQRKQIEREKGEKRKEKKLSCLPAGGVWQTLEKTEEQPKEKSIACKRSSRRPRWLGGWSARSISWIQVSPSACS